MSAMKQLHIPGDWAAPIAFALVAAGTFLRQSNVSAEYAIPGGNLIALACLVVAVLLAVAAQRGRSIEDSATYYYSGGAPTSLVFVGFGTLFLPLGTFAPVGALQVEDWGGRIWGLGFSLGALWLAYTFLLKVQIVVFNVDKTFLTMQGKPWSFTRHYKASEFSSLSMDVKFSPRFNGVGNVKHYCTYAMNGGKKVLLLRDTSTEKARETVKNITHLTGLKLVGGEPK